MLLQPVRLIIHLLSLTVLFQAPPYLVHSPRADLKDDTARYLNAPHVSMQLIKVKN